MNIKDIEVGKTYYVPIEVISVDDEVQAYYAKRKEKGLWDEFDAYDMVTRDEIISTEADDQIDFWKRDSESAHDEIRKLQEQVKRLEDSNGQYAEQVRQYNNALEDAEDKLAKNTLALARAEKKVSELQEYADQLKEIADKTGDENDNLRDQMKSMCVTRDAMCECDAEFRRKIDVQRKIIEILAEKVMELEKGKE